MESESESMFSSMTLDHQKSSKGSSGQNKVSVCDGVTAEVCPGIITSVESSWRVGKEATTKSGKTDRLGEEGGV